MPGRYDMTDTDPVWAPRPTRRPRRFSELPKIGDFQPTEEQKQAQLWARIAEMANAAPRPQGGRKTIHLGLGRAITNLMALNAANKAQGQVDPKLAYADAWKRHEFEADQQKIDILDEDRDEQRRLMAEDRAMRRRLDESQLEINKRLATVREEGPEIARERLRIQQEANDERERLRESALGLQREGLSLREQNLARQREVDAALAKYREGALALREKLGTKATTSIVTEGTERGRTSAVAKKTQEFLNDDLTPGVLSENEKDELARLGGTPRVPANSRMPAAKPPSALGKSAPLSDKKNENIPGGNPKAPKPTPTPKVWKYNKATKDLE